MTGEGQAAVQNTKKSIKNKGVTLLKRDKLEKMMDSMSGDNDDEDPDNDGDGVTKPFSNPSKDKKKKPKMETVK